MGSLISFVVLLAFGGAVTLVIAIVAVVLFMRGRGGGGGNDAGPRMPATAAWQQGAYGLGELGMRALDAECFTVGVPGGSTLYVKAELSDKSMLAWLHQAAPGGAIEQFIGASADVRPGGRGGSPLARFVAASVFETLGALPGRASLSVKAPEMPGDQFKATLTAPLWSPQHPALVARVLLALNEAARRPPAEGVHPQTQLSPVVSRWMAAGPAIEAVGLRKIDAELYTYDLGGGVGGTAYLSVEVRDGTVRCWVERAFAGGPLDQFLGARAELHPGQSGHGALAQLVAATVREPFGALPHRASLTVKGPEMPGAEYSISLTTPLDAPEHAALAARVVLTLDAAVQRPAAGGAAHPPNVSPAVAHWMASAPAFQALGMRALDAECWVNGLGAGTLYVKIDVPGSSVRGWIESTCPGGVLEGYLRKQCELRPGAAPSSELAQGILGAVQGLFAALPRQAVLTVKAPEISGATYSLSLSSPLGSPEHGPAVARVLLALDEAVRRVH